MIDEREPGSEFAAVIAVARPPTNGRARVIEALPPLPPRAPASTAVEIPDRRPARAATAAPYNAADFPLRFVRAMHDAARSYRERISEEIELRRVALLTGIREHRRAEVLRARRTAAHERRAVDAWAATAQRQIKSERQRRKVEIEADLRRTLRDQNEQVERRVKEVEAALAAHRAEVDSFFDELEQERDPVVIAQRARQRPSFPVLDATPPSAESDGPAPTD